MKYNVMTCHEVSVCEDVEADSPEEALEKSEGYLSLCCQCEGDVGEVVFTAVSDEDGNTVLEDNPSPEAAAFEKLAELLGVEKTYPLALVEIVRERLETHGEQ